MLYPQSHEEAIGTRREKEQADMAEIGEYGTEMGEYLENAVWKRCNGCATTGEKTYLRLEAK